MKTFYEYLADTKREYKYKIKFAVPVDDEMLDKLELVLLKYDVIEMTNPKKSILQRNLIDFPNLGPVETFTISIISSRPIYTLGLLNDISACVNVSENFLKVRSEFDPLAIDDRFSAELEDINKVIGDAEVATAIGTQPIPDEIKVLYGDDYNKDLLTYLAKNRVLKDEKMTDADIPTSFNFLKKLDTKAEDYNKDFDTVKPVSAFDVKDAKNNPTPAPTTELGNVSPDNLVASKTIVGKDGKLRKIKRTGE